MIERDGGSRRVIIAPLAVASTSIVTWTEAGPVRDALDRLVADLREARLTPTAILWQQGETDADIGTMARDYRQRFAGLVMRLRAQGIAAPVFVARSSYCHGDGHGYIGRVQTALPGSIPGVEAGADTDAILGSGRYDDCHFSHVGLQEAAQRWYYVLREKLFRPETGISKDAVVPR